MTGEPGGEIRFKNRTEAGRQLAQAITDSGLAVDIVLAIPRGGLPLGRSVADTLGVPLDIVVASKIGAPGNPEFAIGAAASDGSVWLDEETIEQLGIDESYIERERKREAEIARGKAEKYRGEREVPDLRGKSVVIVDDGVATGSTAIAAVRLIREQGAGSVILAIPVGPPDTIGELADEADEVICVTSPSYFGAVGQFYDEFGQVSDEEAIAYLHGKS